MTKYLVRVVEYAWDPFKKGVSQHTIAAKSLDFKSVKPILALLQRKEGRRQ